MIAVTEKAVFTALPDSTSIIVTIAMNSNIITTAIFPLQIVLTSFSIL